MISIKAKDGTVTLSLSAGLERFEQNKSLIYKDMGQSLLVSIQEGFEAEQSPEGEAWEPLKRATIVQRRGDAHPILKRKGRLRDKIVYKINPDSVTVGTDISYAAAHQFGVVITRKDGATKLHFRRISRGPHKGQVRFAKASDKRTKYGMATAAHTIRIPARPYLFQRDGDIPDNWKQALVTILKRYLELDHA